MRNPEYNAIIVGAGSIGALKDKSKDNRKTKEVLTIAHAFYSNKDINLYGIVDVDIEKVVKAQKRWKVEHGAVSVEALVSVGNGCIDIAAVACDTEHHYSVILEILRWCPEVQVILVEKPFCEYHEQAQEIKELCEANGVTLVVDYIRRFDPAISILKENMLNRELIKIYSCIFYYNRGLKRDGCHAIDLIHYLFGDIVSFDRLSGESPIFDLSAEDPTIGLSFVAERCPHVVMIPVDGREVGLFDMEIITSDGKIIMKDYGTTIQFYPVVKGNEYGDYPVLRKYPIVFKTELTTALKYMAENLVGILQMKELPRCSADDALKVQEILWSINFDGGHHV